MMKIWLVHHLERKQLQDLVHSLEEIVVTWKSKKQRSCSIKCWGLAMAHTICEHIWLRSLLKKMNQPFVSLKLYCDNQGSIYIEKNNDFNQGLKRMKSIVVLLEKKVEATEIIIPICSPNRSDSRLVNKASGRKWLTECTPSLGVSIPVHHL